MPVIELSEAETRTVDRELMLDYVSQLAIEDRRAALSQMPGALEHAQQMWFGRATTQKRSTLSFIARDRALPCGARAELPAEFFWVRCPEDNLLILFWGEDAIVEGDRARLRMPYVPLPRYLDDDELDALQRARAAERVDADTGGDRFAGLDLS